MVRRACTARARAHEARQSHSLRRPHAGRSRGETGFAEAPSFSVAGGRSIVRAARCARPVWPRCDASRLAAGKAAHRRRCHRAADRAPGQRLPGYPPRPGVTRLHRRARRPHFAEDRPCQGRRLWGDRGAPAARGGRADRSHGGLLGPGRGARATKPGSSSTCILLVRTPAESRRSGSQIGSQRPQTPGGTRPRLAHIYPARWLIELHQTTHSDASMVPSKQRVAGSNPAGRTHMCSDLGKLVSLGRRPSCFGQATRRYRRYFGAWYLCSAPPRRREFQHDSTGFEHPEDHI